MNIYADHLRAGTFAAYNSETKLKQWKAPCNKFDGASDAVKFPAEIQPNQSLSFFMKSMCRAVPMVSVFVFYFLFCFLVIWSIYSYKYQS